MSFGWRVSQRFLNGLMLAVYVMLAACVPIDETFDYRYAALQSDTVHSLPQRKINPQL